MALSTKVLTLFKALNNTNIPSYQPPPDAPYFMEFKAMAVQSTTPSQARLSLAFHQSIETFVRSIIVSIDELNAVKKDIEFLLYDMFERSDFIDHNVPLERCTIFFVWTCIPYENDITSHTRHDLHNDTLKTKVALIPFDIAFVRRDVDIRKIQEIRSLLQTGNTYVYSRHPGEKVTIPYNLKSYFIQTRQEI